jgi:hypothetical protein
MNHRMRSGMVIIFLAVLVSAALLGGCGKSDSGSIGPATASVHSAATPTAGLSTCASCHPPQTTDWLTSKHANLDSAGNLYSAGSPTLGMIGGCTKNCHDPNGDSNNLTAGYTGNVPRPVIGCETCHGPGSLHANAGGSGPISLLSNTTGTTLGSVPVSGQFVMCTSCHELLNSAGTGTNPNPAHLTTSPTGTPYIITDTHFATPGNWPGGSGANTIPINGYAMDYANEQVCVDCHNPHKPATENREWAQSAHGDKNPFDLNATQTGYFSGAWAHYNWSLASRTACQRCHTTTGFAAYADALRTGNTKQATLISAGTASPPPLASSANFKPEMLKCNGCHTDNKGTLRNPGAANVNYDFVSGVNTYAKASHVYPDVAGSNVCMACHTGREIGETIKGLNDPALLSAGTITTFNFANSSFINSHYLTAGGQVFTVTGYEFDGRPYNNITEYRHDKIGTPATLQLAPYVNTGSNGPCIGCHMSRPNKNGNHLFLPISRSTVTYGEVTGIASEVCFNCHGPSTTLILDMVREQKQQFAAALEALNDQLVKRGYYFAPYNPYFYTAVYNPAYTEIGLCTANLPVKNWQTGGTSTFVGDLVKKSCTSSAVIAGTAGTGNNNMGAAFNLNLLDHDPGAYVHNRMYVKRLIYDSIDWLDDGVMNYSVGATLNTVCSGGTPPAYCAEAMTYLLPNGVLGIEAERP